MKVENEKAKKKKKNEQNLKNSRQIVNVNCQKHNQMTLDQTRANEKMKWHQQFSNKTQNGIQQKERFQGGGLAHSTKHICVS